MIEQPLAIVTDANHPTGLGAGRALFQAGVTVIGLTPPSTASTLRSRAWHELHVVNGGNDAWVEKIRELSARAGRPVFLMPASDRLVEVLSLRRDDLGENVRLTLPPHPVVELMLDKTRFYEWAAKRGFPVPESRAVQSPEELREALARSQYPLVIKPLWRTEEWNRVSPTHKAYKLNAARDLERIPFPLFDFAPAYLVSRWIEGPDDAVHYCLAYCTESGRIDAASTGRKLLQHPRFAGSTAICVGTDNLELTALTADLFRELAFVGMGSLELKYDLDGKPWITEPTVGRPNLQSYSAFAQRENLYARALEHALGTAPPSARKRKRNVVWVQEAYLLRLARARTGSPVPWGLIVRTLFSVRRVSGAYGSWWDPAPLVALIWSTARSTWTALRTG